MAEKVLNVYLGEDIDGENVRFLRSGLETCGPSYLFLDRNKEHIYVVCEDGKVYRYIRACQS